MKLHVVMVALNNATMTAEAVESILSPCAFQVHLIDQESVDTFECITNKNNVSYTRFSPKVSLSQAWNFGILKALEDPECEYILIPNNDVLFHPDTVKRLMWGIDNLGYAMVTGENLAPRYSVKDFMELEKPGDVDFDSRPITDWREEGPDFSCFLIKRDFVEKYGLFDENFFPAYCEDQDMHARIVKSGGHAKRLTIAPYYHFGSQTVIRNADIRGWVGQGHEHNKAYYRTKWGNEHPEVLDGKGFNEPYNEPGKPLSYWRGVEKYGK